MVFCRVSKSSIKRRLFVASAGLYLDLQYGIYWTVFRGPKDNRPQNKAAYSTIWCRRKWFFVDSPSFLLRADYLLLIYRCIDDTMIFSRQSGDMISTLQIHFNSSNLNNCYLCFNERFDTRHFHLISIFKTKASGWNGSKKWKQQQLVILDIGHCLQISVVPGFIVEIMKSSVYFG